MTVPKSADRRRAVKGGITPARAAAAEICAAMRVGELLDPAFERHSAALEARDRRWLRELVYGMLRRRSWLDAVVHARVKGAFDRLEAEVVDLLRLGTYQLLYMNSVPAYAAIAQTVELAKRRAGAGASGLVNAVLRRIDRERGSLGVELPEDSVSRLALEHSHPEWLVRRWVERFGTEGAAALLAANNEESTLVLRPVGVSAEELRESLEAAGVVVEDAALATGGLEIRGGMTHSLTELEAFARGQFHMQDPASTLVTQYAAIPEGAIAADLCAAPGGKSAEVARSARTVIASDVSAARIGRVAENIERLRLENVHALVADARHPAVAPPDAVLIDVPCTGTGTFRRHPDARWRLKPADLAVMGGLQSAILRSAAELVKPGGLLVYSTCSMEPEENDEQVDRFLAEAPEFSLEPPDPPPVPGAVLDGGRLRVLPHVHGTDGAFAVRLRRRVSGS
jgi:16S rRNA (cytosine967-C5)-methyltransferase